MREPVLEHVKKVEQSYIRANVYDVYEPSVYERREDNGGLLDTANIKVYPVPEGYRFINETKASDFDVPLSPIIQEGKNPKNEKYFNGKGEGAYSNPRLFEQPTAENLAETLPQILKDIMK